MQFSQLPDIRTEHVYLRPIRESDLQDWFDYLTVPGFLDHTSRVLKAVSELVHAIYDPASHAADTQIGSIGFHSVQPAHCTAELAYDLSRKAWGKRTLAQLIPPLLDWVHSEVGIIQVQTHAHVDNTRSIHVLERAGFIHEGTLHCLRMVRGQPSDFQLYAHVRTET
ncbi:GNAT family N-acetyltransferase [Burkholderiaceae bacterium DAT-1]|nr:GNAT family N-acetyltransferase [Burkholderiaceae bacterium DAT-1]